MLSRARDYFSSRPQAATSVYRSVSGSHPGGTPATPSTFGSVSSASLSPASQALSANTGALYASPAVHGTAAYYPTPAYNATQLQPYPSPSPSYGDPRQSTYTSPRQRKSSVSKPFPIADTPQYGVDPHRSFAAASQQSFQSFGSIGGNTKQDHDKRGRRKRSLSDAAPPPQHFYTEPAYRAQQIYPSGPGSPAGSAAYAAVPTPGSMGRNSGRAPSMQSLHMAVYTGQENTPVYAPREVFTPDPPRQPNVLRRRRTVSSSGPVHQPPPLHVHQAPVEPASYESSHMHHAHAHRPRAPGHLPTIKFKRKGVPVGGLLLSEAIAGVRMSRKDRYPVREMHTDSDMNVLIKVTWPGCRSLTYAIAINNRDGRVDLTSLARRVARACHHFLDARQVMVPREHMRIHRIEEFSSGHWQVVMSAQ